MPDWGQVKTPSWKALFILSWPGHTRKITLAENHLTSWTNKSMIGAGVSVPAPGEGDNHKLQGLSALSKSSKVLIPKLNNLFLVHNTQISNWNIFWHTMGQTEMRARARRGQGDLHLQTRARSHQSSIQSSPELTMTAKLLYRFSYIFGPWEGEVISGHRVSSFLPMSVHNTWYNLLQVITFISSRVFLFVKWTQQNFSPSQGCCRVQFIKIYKMHSSL